MAASQIGFLLRCGRTSFFFPDFLPFGIWLTHRQIGFCLLIFFSFICFLASEKHKILIQDCIMYNIAPHETLEERPPDTHNYRIPFQEPHRIHFLDKRKTVKYHSAVIFISHIISVETQPLVFSGFFS